MSVLDILESIGLWNSQEADSTMALNYRVYGAAMGFAGYDEFVQRAKSFFDEALDATEENKPGYTRVDLSKKRIAFDYNCEIRGIYTHNGKPVAFFKPNFKAAGFRTAEEELEMFRQGAKPVKA